MLRTNRQGFTLIELMVVIVIIGVLASLAIPRFTDASIKAKVAEAPRVIASFESAYLAGVAEGNVEKTNLVFSETAVNDDSKWFAYTVNVAGASPTDGHGISAVASASLGKLANQTLSNSYVTSSDIFKHSAGESIQRYVPNYKDKQ